MSNHPSNVEIMTLEDDGVFPNSTKPALIYRDVLDGGVSDGAMKALFERNGWPPYWTDTIFDYHHYHSTAHEALGVVSGNAGVKLGGPTGDTVQLKAGDVVVIPAGVAHKLESASQDFLVVGAYPPGQDFDTMSGADGEREMAMVNLEKVGLPSTDPVGGDEGPLLEKWR